ncbi:hydroxypyruvate isomerase family protein [Streptomyces pinistramenti]|uniref:hydroxypyruvate isomerase family protein n=1 Tax=Streptomyces pinistramenti TaxID=2884812 RepID=UPI001D063895|nr:TIM barrel protein [Streptomyces pinistramenti]MCB5906533.1 TIM barrel protein [Streptomyces pinistramenti]
MTPPAPGTIRFAANLKWLFTEVPFEARFDAAAEAGFRAVEIAAPYVLPAAKVRRLLDDAGLRAVLINSPGGSASSPERNGSACIPQLRDTFRAGFDRAWEYADILGSPVIHVMAGIRPDGTDRDTAFAQYVENIAWAADRCKGSGLRLVLETINQRDAPGFLLTSQEQAADVIRTIGADHIELLFDIYHCQVGQGDVTTRLTALLPLIGHIQVADPPTRTEPGTGELAWDFLFGQLRRLGYDGWIGCEYRPATTTLDGLHWRRRHEDRPRTTAQRKAP